MISRMFELRGEWWLPQHPSQKAKGTLKFSPKEGGTLKLDVFQKGFAMIDSFLGRKNILGTSVDGKKATLYGCFVKSMVKHLLKDGSETNELTLYVSVVLVGTHIQKMEDMRFDNISVRFQHLDAWINISGFDIEVSEDSVMVRYQRPKSYLFKVTDELNLCISFGVSYPTIGAVQTEASIKQEVWIGLRPLRPRHLDDYWGIIYDLQNFLTLATTAIVYPLSITGTIKVKDEPDVVVDICRAIGAMESPKELHPSEMLFPYSDISGQFPTIISNWFRKSEELRPFYDLYFGTYYISEIYLTTEFLNYIQALESYHRRTEDNFEFPEDQHQKRLEKILSATPQEYKAWLSEELKYSNEPSLRKRLKDILDCFPLSVESVLKDKNKLINDICVTRNYLTHYDSEIESQAAKNEELFQLTSTVRLILQFCMLNELGFDSGYVEKLTARLIRIRYGYLYQ